MQLSAEQLYAEPRPRAQYELVRDFVVRTRRSHFQRYCSAETGARFCVFLSTTPSAGARLCGGSGTTVRASVSYAFRTR